MTGLAEPQTPALRRPSPLGQLGAWLRQAGLLCATPVLVFFLIGFVGPLVIVFGFSFVPERTFGFHSDWTVDNYRRMFTEGYYIPFLWSFGLASVTVVCNLLISYPIAYGLAKLFGRWAAPVTLLLVIPLFVSENVRLFGWFLFLIKGSGILAGIVKTLFGLDTGTLLFAPGTILMGMIYVYLPFTLFPMVLGLSMVPKDQVDAAGDLGANRWQVFREIELPIAMPGILIGALLTFVLAVGAIAETTLLGGSNIVVISHAIQHEFTYAQNWPLGSAISVLTIVVTGVLIVLVMRRLDLDRLLGRR
ncbi:MAG: ABC transporter permease [Alphaproteobacteria bacterium]